MEYRQLGASGIAVSSVGLGVMTFGGQTPEDDGLRQLDLAYDAGITFFDTAENYPTPLSPVTQGRSEEILGRWIKTRNLKGKVVVATKVTGPGSTAGDLRHIRGERRRLDRANIRQAVEGSLQRLGVEAIDLYQVHWPERAVTTLGRARFSLVPDECDAVPIEETLGALGELVDEGKVRTVGVCNETSWGVMRYLNVAEQSRLPRLASIQNGYSLLDRSFELSLAEVAAREGTGLIAYSPLSGGLLTGKYGAARAAIPGSRSSMSDAFLTRLSSTKERAIEAYGELAAAHGMELAHMALAFVRQQLFTTSVLMAASSFSQLQDNLASLEISLGRDLMRAINAIHDQIPNPR